MADRWVTVHVERALYVDYGINTILCDRLPSPITLVLKNPVHRDGACFPSAAQREFPTSLADRGGTSAAIGEDGGGRG